MPPTSLNNVPLDIQILILGYVDPISLINLAQTCQSLRTTIQPTRANLLQRLLALELLPEYGGIVPIIRGRDNQITPPVDSQAWLSNKYACGGCLQLLPHTMFDNHQILKLDLRKPPPGSREANRLAEWWYLNDRKDDVRARIIQHRIFTRASQQLESLADVRQRHHEATHPDDDMPHQGINQFLAGGEEAEILAAHDRVAYEAELQICGLRRFNRRCNECRFLRGDWRHLDGNLNPVAGLPALPVATGRKLPFYNVFDRCFPTFFSPVPPSEVGRRFTQFGNQWNKAYTWMMCTVRCRGCSRWQDASQFRLPVEAYKTEAFLARELRQYLVRDPVLGELREPRCNRCFLAKHGVDAFRRHLVDFAASLLSDARQRAKLQVLFGWDKLCDDFRFPGGEFQNWAEYGEPIVFGLPLPEGSILDLLHLDVPLLDELHRRYTEFTLFVEKMYQGLPPLRQSILDTRSSQQVMDVVMISWFRLWYDDYYVYESTYRRLEGRLQRINQSGEQLVEYVLNGDPLMMERYDFDVEIEEGEIIDAFKDLSMAL
ncbi:hypothetical protein B0T20DRAFT_459310 [Sordaria brevicollis]|uniref:F-box domain-containing protein n=1 Tax=Sordaria brevicollis TaxID=83679 RepID=A0AAE0PM68_SORBR|nr:hypothetical protein B0T20DRAFT_459310 [Sordaria brevicollis]